MKIYQQQTLLGDTELLIKHKALPMPILAVANSIMTAKSELERLLIVHIKEVVAKYLSVVQRSRGSYLSIELKDVLDKAHEQKRKIRRNSDFQKVQQTLISLVPLLEQLMSRPQSRFYPSQTCKLDFLNQVIQLKIDDVKPTDHVHA